MAQIRLIQLLVSRSALPRKASVLDVGCGIGGTSRYLARNYGCSVTGITISGRQVEMARSLRLDSSESLGDVDSAQNDRNANDPSASLVRYLEMDAEEMGEYFGSPKATDSSCFFDYVWVSEALSHFLDKQLFFRNVAKVLSKGGKLVVADWFKAEGLSQTQLNDDIKPIEGW